MNRLQIIRGWIANDPRAVTALQVEMARRGATKDHAGAVATLVRLADEAIVEHKGLHELAGIATNLMADGAKLLTGTIGGAIFQRPESGQ